MLYFKRQWSQLHAQVDPKKFMKKMEGLIYGEILAFKATNFQDEEESFMHLGKTYTYCAFPLLT